MVDYKNRILIEKAARDAGFEICVATDEASARFKSSLVSGELTIRVLQPGYEVIVQNPSVKRELFETFIPNHPNYQVADDRIVAEGTLALQELAERIFQLSMSLPTKPLDEFRQRTRATPDITETERVVRQRVGQDVFRKALDLYWAGRCAVTGLSDRALLRASHARPWALCQSDEQRLDVFNGFLLAAHLDAAFDVALMSFDESGVAIFSDRLSVDARQLLQAATKNRRVPLTERHQEYLKHHRARFRENSGSEN